MILNYTKKEVVVLLFRGLKTRNKKKIWKTKNKIEITLSNQQQILVQLLNLV